jgi:hypothetical protein
MARLTYPEGNSYAKLAVKSGADAIAVSNHAGGNSMDRVVWVYRLAYLLEASN